MVLGLGLALFLYFPHSSLFHSREGKVTTISQASLRQILEISELSTLECYYNNVAKSVKTKGEGILHLGEKELTFWIEYSGIVKIGVDMSKVDVQVQGQQVTIRLPEAEILSLQADETSLNPDSYILSPDGLNSNKIIATDQTAAIANAQETMREAVTNNSSLLLTAKNRARGLIENYIRKLGGSLRCGI